MHIHSAVHRPESLGLAGSRFWCELQYVIPRSTSTKVPELRHLQSGNPSFIPVAFSTAHTHTKVSYCVASHSIYLLLAHTKNQFQPLKDQGHSRVCLETSKVKTHEWKTLHKSKSRESPKASKVAGFCQLLSALRLSALLCVSSLSVRLAFFSSVSP